MSLYRRLHTPNSPLLPLSPMMMPVPSPSMYLSPYTTSIRSRRSFTPGRLNVLPPPSVSPIRAGAIMSAKSKNFEHRAKLTPEQQMDCSLVIPSVKESIKRARSTARKIEAHRNRLKIPLTPIRRSLFQEESPVANITLNKSLSQLITPTPNQRKNTSNRLYTPNKPDVQYMASSPFIAHNIIGTTPSLLEETFTVFSILKEIHMQKYARLFVVEEIDLFVFLMLTPADLDDMGIDEDDRDIIMNAVHCYTDFFGNVA